MKTCILSFGAALFAARLIAASVATADYTAHEWGTFTSVQGADGVQLEWNPLLLTELPKFVYDRSRPLGDKPGTARVPVLVAKTGLVARQRLETPVIYFYSDKERTVDVTVDFPEGNVTEWYPQQNPLPRSTVRKGEPAARWQKLRVLASDAKTPAFPNEASGSHYYAARVANANPVQIAVPNGAVETENFIFYRGVGRFTAPLTVSLEDASRELWRATNTGKDPLTALLLCEVRGAEGRLLVAGNLAPGESRALPLFRREAFRPIAEIKDEMRRQMHTALVAAGLFAAEAEAMVATWDASWFNESGVRVLYVLPRSWTDRVLPLTLDPVPRGLERVMVGRAEIITPDVEKKLTREVERYRTGDEKVRASALANVRTLDLGRFAEPAIRRLCLADPQNREFGNAAWELLLAAFAPTTTPAPLTARKE